MITSQSSPVVASIQTQIMSKIFLLIFVCILQVVVAAQKCSYIFDDKNVFETVQCVNLASFIDIADEIQGNWTSVKVVNRVSNPHFSNNAGK